MQIFLQKNAFLGAFFIKTAPIGPLFIQNCPTQRLRLEDGHRTIPILKNQPTRSLFLLLGDLGFQLRQVGLLDKLIVRKLLEQRVGLL